MSVPKRGVKPPMIGWSTNRLARNFKSLAANFSKYYTFSPQQPTCHSGEHHAVAAQAQTLEEVEAGAADLVDVEVRNSTATLQNNY